MSYVQITEGTDKKISTLQLTEGADTIHIQRVAFDSYQLYLDTVMSATTTSGTESSKINCSTKNQVVFKVLYTGSTDTADFYITYYDSSDVKTVSSSFTVANTGISDPNHSSYYIGEIIEVDTLGFSKVSITLNSTPSNNVMVLGGGANGDII